MRWMVECTPINVLQPFCWPTTPFHHRPTLASPTPIPQPAICLRKLWLLSNSQQVVMQPGMAHAVCGFMLAVARRWMTTKRCKTIIVVHGMHGQIHPNNIKVLQLFCWPYDPPLFISLPYDHLHPSHSWQFALVVKQRPINTFVDDTHPWLVSLPTTTGTGRKDLTMMMILSESFSVFVHAVQ